MNQKIKKLVVFVAIVMFPFMESAGQMVITAYESPSLVHSKKPSEVAPIVKSFFDEFVSIARRDDAMPNGLHVGSVNTGSKTGDRFVFFLPNEDVVSAMNDIELRHTLVVLSTLVDMIRDDSHQLLRSAIVDGGMGFVIYDQVGYDNYIKNNASLDVRYLDYGGSMELLDKTVASYKRIFQRKVDQHMKKALGDAFNQLNRQQVQQQQTKQKPKGRFFPWEK